MRTMALMLAALTLTACVRTRTDPATGNIDVDVESPAQRGQEWEGTIRGMNAYAAMTGTARARVVEGVADISVTLSGGMAGRTHPWHLHEGKCGSGGAIVGDPYAYSPITIGSDGKATGTARIQKTLNEASDYHVNFHASSSEMSTIVACGEIDD
jgi:hypothetical protein